MPKIVQYELPGIRSYQLTRHADERGFFAEVLRQDWAELLGDDIVAQTAISVSQPGVIRAWHRHSRGQIDYMVILDGIVKIAAYDGQDGSPTRGKIVEVVASSEQIQVVRIPGLYWHGTKNIGSKPSTTLYFFTRLYDYANPDEERRPWNDPTIIDPRTGLPYDWDG
jgi:dTDP-4-dehydrorhamnose 3,5-epimerase